MEPEPYYFAFDQSALWWDRGQRSLLFRRGTPSSTGARAVAIRSKPFEMPLPGPLAGVKATRPNWRTHPAAVAAAKSYGPLP
jgi:hypothetical protein